MKTLKFKTKKLEKEKAGTHLRLRKEPVLASFTRFSRHKENNELKQ